MGIRSNSADLILTSVSGLCQERLPHAQKIVIIRMFLSEILAGIVLFIDFFSQMLFVNGIIMKYFSGRCVYLFP